MVFNDGALLTRFTEDLINNMHNYGPKILIVIRHRLHGPGKRVVLITNVIHSHQHGGTDKLKTNLSLNYFDSEALIETKNYERYIIRTNNDYTINNWIQANVDLNLLYSNANEPHLSMMELMERAPIYNAYWSDGRYADGKDGDNPIAQRDLSGSMRRQNYRVGGKLQLVLTPLKGLTLTGIVVSLFYKGKDHEKI